MIRRLAIPLLSLTLIAAYSSCGKKSSGGGESGGEESGGGDETNNPVTTTTTHNLIMFSGSNKLQSLDLATNAFKEISTETINNNSKTKDGHNGTRMGAVVNGKYYFAAAWDNKGTELWMYDPTKAIDNTNHTNPSLVKEFVSGTADASIEEFVAVGKYLMFNARTAAAGKEVWQFDTTADVSATNPKLAFDLNPGATNSNPFAHFAMNDKLYVAGSKETNKPKLWQFDPAVAAGADNPKQASDLNSGASDSIGGHMAKVGNKLYFTGNSGSETRMYSVDTTAATPAATVVNFNSTGDGNNDGVANLASDGTKYIVFTANSGADGNELWVLDTSADVVDGTNPKMYDLRSGSNGSNISNITWLEGSKFAFVGQRSAALDYDLFVVDASKAFGASNPAQFILTNDTSHLNTTELLYVDGKIILMAEAEVSAELGKFIYVNDTKKTPNQITFPAKKKFNDQRYMTHLSYTTTSTTTSKQ